MALNGVGAWSVMSALVSCCVALPGIARASEATVAYFDADLEPLGSRLASELRSEGYEVGVEVLPAEPGCETYTGDGIGPAKASGQVSVQLGRVAGSQDAACAAIVFTTAAGTRHAQVTASTTDVTRFSIKVAEALNGLSSQAPPPPPPADDDANAKPHDDAPREPATDAHPVTVGATGNVLVDVNHVSPLLGVDVVVEVPLTSDWRMTLDTGATLNELSLKEDATELMTRLAWARLGAAFRVLQQPIEVDLTASMGASVTWVTARVGPPAVARADVATSAMFSAGTACAYPAEAPVQLYAALRGTTLVPALRFALPSGDSAALGYFIAEGALGARARW